jgi:RNA polymerase sigma-70 factor, ECF subfamily
MTRLPAPDGVDLAPASQLAARAGEAAWPGVRVPAEVFTQHVRRTGARPEDLARHGGDLYLACACAHGDATAFRVVERQLLPRLAGPLVRLSVPRTSVDDVLQEVAMVVLTGPRPAIASYSARSALVTWLRVVAMRTAINTLRQASAPRVGELLLNELVDAGEDVELRATRLRFKEEVQRALDASLESLPRRSKTLLRMHYVDGLNIDAIGAVYHVHRATVARWLIAIRSEVMLQLRQRLDLGPAATPSDLRSLVVALHADIQLTLSRLLRSRGAGQG